LTSGCSAGVGGDTRVGGPDVREEPAEEPETRHEQADAAEVRDDATHASAELARVRATQAAYATAATDWTHALQHPGSIGLHRMNCSLALARALDLQAAGEKMLRTDPAFERLRTSALVEGDDVWSVQGEDWIKAVPAAQCLLAATVVDGVLSEPLTQAERDAVYGGAHELTSTMWERKEMMLEHFEAIQRTNRGNSQGEEMGWTASFMIHVEQLVPDEYFDHPDGSREGLRKEAGRLVAALLEQCGDAANCGRPFLPGADLVNNHQMQPHPVYTQSVLTSLGEIAALYHQLGTKADRRIAFPAIERAREVADAIDASLDERFRLVGTYEFIDGDGNRVEHPDPTWSDDYADTTYVVRDLVLPTRDVDSLNQAFDARTNTLVTHVARGSGLWRYDCDAVVSPPKCRATLATQLADWASGLGFSMPFPTDSVDAIGQFFAPDGTLETFVLRGDGLWHTRENADATGRAAIESATICEYMTEHVTGHDVYGAGCQAWMDGGCSGAAPPGCMATAGIDSLSFVWDERLDRMRTYVVADGRIWQYRCDENGAGCSAVASSSSGTLCEQWTYVDAHDRYGGGETCAAWIAEREAKGDCVDAGPAPEGCLPTMDIDAVSQTWDANPADPKLRTYVLAGDTIWAYFCRYADDGAITCEAQYDNDLARQWRAIEPTAGSIAGQSVIEEYDGVVDWGFDAAMQNSAYAFLAHAYGDEEFVTRYESLLAEQERRGMHEHPYFPPHYDRDAATWSFDEPFEGFARMRDTSSMAFTLTEGWRGRNEDAWAPASWPSLDDQLHSHAFFNTLAMYNHAIAYLLFASPGLLGEDPKA
jgi:hypothetical protein